MEITNDSTEQTYVRDLARRIIQELEAGRKVVWFLSADDKLSPTVTVMNLLHKTDLSNLVIMQANEHMGESVTLSSYWLNLLHIGFDPAGATVVPILRTGVDPRNMQEVMHSYGHLLAGYVEAADVTIGQFNLSPDGSLTGMAPATEPKPAEDTPLVGHVSNDIVQYALSPEFVARLRVVFVYAFGEDRAVAVQHLRDDAIAPGGLTQILNRSGEVYIYS